MGNTIVCPLSAESQGDRDSSGHRQRLGEGRPQVPAGDGGGRPGTRGRTESRRGGGTAKASGRARGVQVLAPGCGGLRARGLRRHPRGLGGGRAWWSRSTPAPARVLWLKRFLPSPCPRFPHARDPPVEPAALKPGSKKDEG